MKTILRFFSIGILSLLVFGMATSTQPALACSGGRTIPIEEYIDAPIIVRGQIVEVDDYHSNAIMRVSEYLKGEGAEYILLALYSPESILFDLIRNSGGGCRLPVTAMNTGDEITIFLVRELNGSYRLAKSNKMFGNMDYFTDENPIDYSLSYDNITSLNDLGDVIEELTGETPKAPLPDMPYPMIAPLLITTELGSNYIVPVDGSEVILLGGKSETIYYPWGIKRYLYACWEANCQAHSFNGLDSATINNDGTIKVFYHNVISGEGVLFPPIQGIVTVWDATSTNVAIGIYRFELFPDDPFEPIDKIELKTDTIYPNSGAWSPNGRLLAFADVDGIYLWDVFTPNSQPELLITTDIKTIQGFSPLGTYLVVGDDADGFTVDLISKNVYPAGVFSPDESSMITYGDFRQIYFRPYSIDEGYEEFLPIHEIYWINERNWVLVTCEDEAIKESCEIVHGGFRAFSPNTRNGHIFAYDPITHSRISVWGDANLDGRGIYPDDLSPYLDSPIASIEWLPSLFYYDD